MDDEKQDRPNGKIELTSIVGRDTGEPMVDLAVVVDGRREVSLMMTTREAYMLSVDLARAASQAETLLAMQRFMASRGAVREAQDTMLDGVREWHGLLTMRRLAEREGKVHGAG
jgi:hypothetical protein